MDERLKYKDVVSKAIYDITFTDAQAQGICVSCKEQALPKCYSKEGHMEYTLSGLCELCFDRLVDDTLRNTRDKEK